MDTKLACLRGGGEGLGGGGGGGDEKREAQAQLLTCSRPDSQTLTWSKPLHV